MIKYKIDDSDKYRIYYKDTELTNIRTDSNGECNIGTISSFIPLNTTYITAQIKSANTGSGVLRIEPGLPSAPTTSNVWIIGTVNKTYSMIVVRAFYYNFN